MVEVYWSSGRKSISGVPFGAACRACMLELNCLPAKELNGLQVLNTFADATAYAALSNQLSGMLSGTKCQGGVHSFCERAVQCIRWQRVKTMWKREMHVRGQNTHSYTHAHAHETCRVCTETGE
jgi:hypothetical protein